MQYGICQLSIVPIRLLADEASEMSSQLLYGDYFKILEQRKFWSKIRVAFDGYEGWVSNNQITIITEEEYKEIEAVKDFKYTSDLVSFATTESNSLIPLVVGSSVLQKIIPHNYDGEIISCKQSKENLVHSALLYLNAPYLWGGKTPFGIDCSGLTQMVYKINGYKLLRNAADQAKQGEPLSFIEESEPGDLAFFDNNEGIINHVGIIMKNNYIIHSHGKVRIDRIDHTGIFNAETRNYTHKLRVIKKVI